MDDEAAEAAYRHAPDCRIAVRAATAARRRADREASAARAAAAVAGPAGGTADRMNPTGAARDDGPVDT